ncbi:MAG: inositol monophosphatase [Burkholderiales bacterium]|jgi:myo-inositol-1(or 4)-monophosphatase|nr:inositol monophosphatase [Burkholderiales bacterium]
MASGIINIASRAAYAAANVIQRGSVDTNKLRIEKKGHNNYATELDKKAEEIIIDVIKKSFPSHNILAEESGAENNNSDCTWIIDPIDGTTNFMHTHPQYSISIAFKEGDKVTGGIILDPNRNDLYRAELGKGAFLNDRRIRVTKVNYLEDALLATGFPTYDMNLLDTYLKIFRDMLLNTQGQRRQGSAALDLAYVAAGYIDGFWEFNLSQWDFAAGYLLVKEAGGIVTDFAGNSDFWTSGNIVAANPKLLTQILKVIQAHI